ncbi:MULTISPECIES: hypothetical protein [Myroides]|uniref:Uncharacterized protein n=1 Tax=Myroides albus TaxID=2562892 RepID=A0A6I3LLE5_9FLAO|nr:MULTISPECIES: hypothetical protein [Myroides]MTG97002.1 hypothetical protein [Myroides albus]MVX34469.1 hypothetical protein [Myroides sp. LoEW2-1]UVD80507.1 hypothetical protein NWE55_04345 [Myroides albus]
MDKQQIEEIFNMTFAGLSLFYRDCELSQNLINKYQIGQIIQERGFTDATYKGGGLATNMRYLIASAHAKDVAALVPQMEEYGLVMIQSGAYYKVLDTYQVGGQTQVTLLHIAEETVDFFKENSSNIEDQIASKAREGFLTKLKMDVISCLQNPEWIERTAAPLGMSDSGELNL